jgi:hypothetical protein
MTTVCRSLGAARLATFLLVSCVSSVDARAQMVEAAVPLSTPTPPYGLFQYSTLTGSGNTITASWVPVVTASGATVYKNVTLQFNVDATGDLTLTSGYPKVIPAPFIQVSSFEAGNYAAPSSLFSGKGLVTVTGPGVTAGGATEWSMSVSPSANGGTYPASATWYVGPLASSPLATRLQNAGITSTAWSYGLGSYPYGNVYWGTGSLLGFSQTGNQLTIVTFTYGGKDQSTPLDLITYTLVQ